MTMKMKRERRRLRTDDITRALTYQLDACREAADADAMLISDEHGMCVASVGESGTCWEVAARLPMLGRKTDDFEGVLLGGALGGFKIAMRKLVIAGTELYVALVGGAEDRTPAQIERSAIGVARILATG
jgi:hypothetical protein